MKKILLLAIMLVGMPFFHAMAQDAELRVRQVAESYIKGIDTRDFKFIRDVCHPTAKLMGADREGELRVTTLDDWSKNFVPGQKRFDSLKADIKYVNVVRTIAQVRIDFVVNGDRSITDFLHVAKIKGRWLILNIIDG